MARKRTTSGVSKRTKSEALSSARSSLVTLSALAHSYDSGHFDCSRDICVVLHRLISSELYVAGIRTQINLPSLARLPNRDNLMPQWGLVGFEQGAFDEEREITTVTAIPNDETCVIPRALPFSKWWSEVIYVEGAGGGTGFMPLVEEEEIPFKRRGRVLRRELIERTRNEIGAHYDENVSDLWNFYTRWDAEMSFATRWKSGNEWSSDENPDHFNILNTVADAAIRCVAQEILVGLPSQIERQE